MTPWGRSAGDSIRPWVWSLMPDDARHEQRQLRRGAPDVEVLATCRQEPRTLEQLQELRAPSKGSAWRILRLAPAALSPACAVVCFPCRPSSELVPRPASRSALVCPRRNAQGAAPIASPASLGDDPSKWDPAECDALLRGGEQVASVLQEMVTLMEDMEMDGAFQHVAVELVAQGVIGKRVDEMESGFLMALDYMIQLAHKDSDDEVLDRDTA
ncbi:hypothetical protein HU200_009048 [Digitaria exilis]|uniref:Uncharacterized protein n=1 Tax=Digitaria exilis TaxID=1010633 RepID=A0A835FKI4_9POAL|nr:hypothetical protein HU200_009048 [Digitaria exilis]